MHFYCIFKFFFYFSAQPSLLPLSYLVEPNFTYPPLCFFHIQMAIGKHVYAYTPMQTHTPVLLQDFSYCFIVYLFKKIIQYPLFGIFL